MTAVWILTTISILGMVGSGIWGFLTERFRIQDLLMINALGSGLIFLSLYWAVRFRSEGVLGTGTIFFLAALHGIFHGGKNPMMALAWAEFFGRHSLGRILGLSLPFHFTANAIGPVFAGLCFDLFGSYTIPFNFFVVIFFLSGIVSRYLQPLRYRSQASIN